ncbi:L-lactate permease [Brevibacterium sp. 5221]|uniref:L-lactate permease n=1 Tax=Brevibacterium rongguiense TaxID=2695267 RepID=A0A6N9H814_9MICO|nr:MULTISPECIES: L-lactate permease [Brevibacterium]MYM20160.1 L-lactate permease [Brevibacterium rongguiense]WAL39124.1 L-lactate permease [Brevibacterium sp. BRM-1]
MPTFTPAVDAVGGSVALSALVGLIPLVTFFILLAVVRLKAHTAGLCALVVALIIAVIAFHMPVGYALMSAIEGGAFGIHPVLWIVVMAIWLYQVTVVSGRFQDLRSIFNVVGHGDLRVQAMLIAFCFGGLLEALAGFGAPVAITATMVMALGVKPLRAAAVVLVANTAPVAYGAVATPITTAGKLTEIDPALIGALVGRQAPILACVVPLILLFLVDGRRAVKDLWPLALVVGFGFAIAQFLASNFFSYELTDIVASLVGLLAAMAFMAVWKPRGAEEARVRLDAPEPPPAERLGGQRIFLALLPYLLVIVVFTIAKVIKPVAAALASTDIKVAWPVLSQVLVDSAGKPVSSTSYSIQWLSSPGSLLAISAIIVAAVYALNSSGGRFPVTFGAGLAEFPKTVYRMRWAGLTVILVLSLAYVMNQSGQTVSIGVWLAGTGVLYPFLSPILGWIGTAVTGSDTSANALFAKLQQTAAGNVHVDPALMVAANTSGGVVGKLISPQNLAIAATAAEMPGQESQILRTVVGWSVGLLLILCLLVFLQTTPVLGWMTVHL